jgi:hypothetical protein
MELLKGRSGKIEEGKRAWLKELSVRAKSVRRKI